MTNKDEIIPNQELTLQDIKKHLERQDRQTAKSIYLSGAGFGGAVALVGISLWLGSLSQSIANYIFLIVVGVGFMAWCQNKQQKIKD